MRFAKLIITDKWGTRETPAYIFKEDDKTLSFANMNTGTFGQADRKDVDEKTLKGYTADAKKLIKEYVKAELKAKALEEQIRELRNPYRNIKEKLTKANGLLTPSEFLEELKKNGLEIDGRYYTDVSLCNNFLNIDADKVIKKWIGESEFTYREYDGQLCMTDGCKKSKLYQRILRENSCRTNVKKGIFEESLSVGDKDTLHYCMNITVEVKKPLTAEYAKELAKKIIA